MKKTALFIVLAVILTACPTPEPPECPEPTDTLYLDYSHMDIFVDVLNVPENVGVIILSDTTPTPECPEPPVCPDVQHVERFVIRDAKAGDSFKKGPDQELFCVDEILIESVQADTVEVPVYKDTCITEPEPPVDTTEYDGNAYVVHPDGDDNNPGTIDEPWQTWYKAFNNSVVGPSDTIYIRGGTYPYPTWLVDSWDGIPCTINGAPGAMIHIFNYPGEVPILSSEGIRVDTTLEWPKNRALRMRGFNGEGNHYLHFRGLTIQDVYQRNGTGPTSINGRIEASAWQIRGTNCIIEQCIFQDIDGVGLILNVCDKMLVVNNDAFRCVDWHTSIPIGKPMPGNDGTGFSDWNPDNPNASNQFHYNRAWDCGDQGFTSGSVGYSEYIGNWSFNNGKLEGGGHGYKMGWIPGVGAPLNRLYKDNLAVNNTGNGWDTNEGNRPSGVLQTKYNIAYANGVGYRVLNSSSDISHEQNRVYERNVAYDNGQDFLLIPGAGATEIENSWNKSVAVTNNWFLSLDASQLTLPRKLDGSLPDITFLKLTEPAKTIMGW